MNAAGAPETVERIFVALGANLGDAPAALRDALAAIGQLPQTRCVGASALYRSAPVDASGPDFYNAVAEVRSALEPEALLRELQAIELAHGRQRPYRNAPRTLDLDLVAYGQRVQHSEVLTLPHPRAHLRAFVLRPLAELAGEGFELPSVGAIGLWLQRCADQRIERLNP